MGTHKVPVSILKISPDGSELVLASGSHLQAFSMKDGGLCSFEGDNHTEVVRSISYNSAGNALVTTSDDKQVKVWLKQHSSWAFSTSKRVNKKTMAAAFAPDNKTIVFADKFGDVLTFDITGNEKEQLVMGHYASITDMILSPDGKYLLTSDKDEHIRISHYPEVYDIQCYCFGHTQFVSGLLLLAHQPDFLISGGGDASLRLWNWHTGDLIHSFQFEGQEGSEDAPTIIPLAVSFVTNLIVVAIEG